MDISRVGDFELKNKFNNASWNFRSIVLATSSKYISISIAKKLKVCQALYTISISIDLSRNIRRRICYPTKSPAKIELNPWNPSLFFPLNLATLSTPSQYRPPKLAKTNCYTGFPTRRTFPRHYTNQLTRPTCLVVRYPSDSEYLIVFDLIFQQILIFPHFLPFRLNFLISKTLFFSRPNARILEIRLNYDYPSL